MALPEYCTLGGSCEWSDVQRSGQADGRRPPLTSPDSRSRLLSETGQVCSSLFRKAVLASYCHLPHGSQKCPIDRKKGGGCGKVKDGRNGRFRVAPRCSSKRHLRAIH